MATFDQLYQMMQGRQSPLFNLQQIQTQMPGRINAPAPPGGNTEAAGLFARQMNQIGAADRDQQGIDIAQQRADTERERARAMADLQMQTYRAEQEQLQRKRADREAYAGANPEFAAGIMAGERPSDFQRKMQIAGGDPARYREMFGPGAGVTVNAGTGAQTYKVPSNYMLRDPTDPAKGVIPIPGGPGEKRAGDSAGKEAMLDVAMTGIPRIKEGVFEGGDINAPIRRDVLFGKSAAQAGVPGAWVPEGAGLAGDMERGIQAITRIETGAAMAPTELENTRKRFEPSPLDSDTTIRQKVLAYEMFLSNAKDYLDPAGNVNVDKALEDAAKQIGESAPAGLNIDQDALNAELKRRGL